MNNYLKSNYDLDFRIVIIEQTDDNEFNRGKLINIGATITTDCNYFILHDYEHLEYMVNDLNSKFNTNHKLPYINKSNNDNYKSYYNDELIEFINLLYKNDIVLFNYKFD